MFIALTIKYVFAPCGISVDITVQRNLREGRDWSSTVREEPCGATSHIVLTGRRAVVLGGCFLLLVSLFSALALCGSPLSFLLVPGITSQKRRIHRIIIKPSHKLLYKKVDPLALYESRSNKRRSPQTPGNDKASDEPVKKEHSLTPPSLPTGYGVRPPESASSAGGGGSI